MQIVLPPLLEHERRVREMMSGFKQEIRVEPSIPDTDTLILRARLKLEETLEFIHAAGLRVSIDLPQPSYCLNLCEPLQYITIEEDPLIKPDLPMMVKELADDSVVNTGTFAALGVRMGPVLEAVDANNLLKIATGKKDDYGKFTKHPNHPKPPIDFVLHVQGWPHKYGKELRDVNLDGAKS